MPALLYEEKQCRVLPDNTLAYMDQQELVLVKSKHSTNTDRMHLLGGKKNVSSKSSVSKLQVSWPLHDTTLLKSTAFSLLFPFQV